MSLGIVKNEQDFNVLAQAATKIALRLGTDVTSAIADMTTALGRGSPLILDNLGVQVRLSDAHDKYAQKIGTTVKALTDEQKTLAFREAAMEALLKSANETTVAFDGNAAAVLRFKTSLSDLWGSIKGGIANATGAVLQPLVTFNDELVQMIEFAKIASDQRGPLGVLADRMIRYAEAANGATNSTYEWLAAQALSADELARVQGAQDKERAASLRERLERDRASYVQAAREEDAKHREVYAKRDAFWRERGVKDAEEAKKEHDRKKKTKDKDLLDPGDVTIQRSYFGGMEDSDTLVLDMERRRDADQAAMVEREIQRREENIASIEREIEVRQAAELDYSDLLAQRQAAEDDLYDYTRQKSRDRQRLSEAETRHEKQQHERRLADAKAAAQKQAAWAALFQQTIADTATNVSDLTNTLIDAFQRQADGEKHAIAVSIEAYLAGLKKKMAAKAVEETVLGIAAMASYRYAEGALHFTAAGIATGIALGAFAGQHAVRGAAENSTGKDWSTIQQENEGGDADKNNVAGEGSGSSKNTGSGASSSRRNDSRELEKMDVPVSFEETRRRDASATTERSNSSVPSVTIVVQGNVIGEGGKKELGQYMHKLLNDTRGHSRRA